MAICTRPMRKFCDMRRSLPERGASGYSNAMEGKHFLGRWAVPALLGATALVFLPFGAHPFSRPKLALLCAGALLAAAAALRAQASGPRVLALLWLGSTLIPG